MSRVHLIAFLQSCFAAPRRVSQRGLAAMVAAVRPHLQRVKLLFIQCAMSQGHAALFNVAARRAHRRMRRHVYLAIHINNVTFHLSLQVHRGPRLV